MQYGRLTAQKMGAKPAILHILTDDQRVRHQRASGLSKKAVISPDLAGAPLSDPTARNFNPAVAMAGKVSLLPGVAGPCLLTRPHAAPRACLSGRGGRMDLQRNHQPQAN